MTDAHCHLQYLSDIGAEVQRCKAEGITSLICVGFDIKSSQQAIKIATKFPNVWATVGVHPEEISNFQFPIFNELLKLAKFSKVVGIGECGLDFIESTTPEEKTRQIELLKLHIELAQETKLPLVIHNRNADSDLLKIINYKLKIKTMLHCFTGDIMFMKESIARGWYISFGGILTFKRSEYLREIAKLVPENLLLIETDSPYLAPEPHRGSQNRPKNVKIVAELLAKLRGTSINRIEEITDQNVMKLFHIPHPA